MKKSNLLPVVIVLLAQVLCAAFLLVREEMCVAGAPQIRVAAGPVSLSSWYRYGDAALLFWRAEHVRADDTTRFGRSIYFSPRCWENEEEQPPDNVFSSPQPDASLVRGAADMGDLSGRCSCSSAGINALWRPGPDGVWLFRLEAAGSSEDVLRPGEVRTPAVSVVFSNYITREDGVCVPCFSVNFAPDWNYRLNDEDRRTLAHWAEDSGRSDALFTFDFKVCEGRKPLLSGVRLLGMPLRKALRLIREGGLPSPRVGTAAGPLPQESAGGAQVPPAAAPQPAQPSAAQREEAAAPESQQSPAA